MSDSVSVGLDLGSHTIKVVELKRTGSTFTLVKAGMAPSSSGGLMSETDIELTGMSQTIKKLFKDNHISGNDVRVALPESQVYTFVIETPALSERELASSIRWEAEQYIPVPLEDVAMDWKILVRGQKENEKNLVLLVASAKRVIDKYQKVLENAGFSMSYLETELIAASRSLTAAVNQLKSIMVVNMGHSTTDFSILHDEILLFTRSIGIGGLALSRSLIDNLQLTEGQAQEYKKTYGLDENQLGGKVYKALIPLLDTVVAEMKKGLGFFHEKYPNDKLDVVLISGSTSLLPGLVPYLVRELGVEVQIPNPFAVVKVDDKIASSITQTDGAVYAVALGLAMREG